MARKKRKAPTTKPVVRPATGQRAGLILTLGIISVGILAVFVIAATNGSNHEDVVRHGRERAVAVAREIAKSGERPIANDPRERMTLGWDIADSLLADRERFDRVVGLGDIPEFAQYTPAYFRALAERREEVIAWASTEPSPPRIVFIGVVHVDSGGWNNSPEFMTEIVRVQTAAFEMVREHARDASVIAIEDSGSDEVLTSEHYVEMSYHVHLGFYGFPLPREEIRSRLYADAQASARAIVELPSVPVICGEEWPILFGGRLILRGPPQDPLIYETTMELMGRLIYLRSEIILIRTLEFLRRTGGSKGIIIQGNDHGSQIEALADEYHVSFVGLSAL